MAEDIATLLSAGCWVPSDLQKRCQRAGQAADALGVVGDVGQVADGSASKPRGAEGPTLVECKTYRVCGQLEGDDCHYRTQDEVEAATAFAESSPLPAPDDALVIQGEGRAAD